MEANRLSRALVSNWDDLLRLTGCADAEQLDELLDGEVETSAAIDLDSDGVTIGVDWRKWESLAFPFPIRAFWTALYSLEAENWRHSAVVSLTEYDEDDEDPDDCSRELGRFLGLKNVVFRQLVGGHWTPQDPAIVDLELDEDDPDSEDQRWFGSGEPVQVLIGVLAEWVLVASPSITREGDNFYRTATVVRTIRLGQSATLHSLAATIRRTQRRRQRSLRYCQCCRRIEEPENFEGDWCRGCYQDAQSGDDAPFEFNSNEAYSLLARFYGSTDRDSDEGRAPTPEISGADDQPSEDTEAAARAERRLTRHQMLSHYDIAANSDGRAGPEIAESQSDEAGTFDG
ncbi:MAG: hypothetical protein M3P04_14095 [Actinomycetota bacterium]|nr:hypothetical protein [Actinomycetota bacterium]